MFKTNVSIEEKISKNGKPYKVIIVTFENGYTYTNYLTSEQSFIIELNKKY